MSRFVVAALAVFLAFVCIEARIGVDVSSLYKQDSWDCINKKGYDFAIVRCYRSLNIIDENCAESVKRAWAAGMKNVDLYMFPCAKCSDREGQVRKLFEYIRENNIQFDKIWIDIEGKDKYWHSSKDENRKIFEELCSAATRAFADKFAGLYVSHHSWKQILGLDYTGWGNVSVWYANWDHKAGMGNWEPYGGFTEPTMHQYSGTQHYCDMHVDLDYRED